MAVAQLSKPLGGEQFTDEPITDEMLLRLPREYGHKWELVDGKLHKVPTTPSHDQIVLWLGYLMMPYADHGMLTGSQAGFRMAGGNLRLPDLGFTRYDRMPNGEVPDGFMEFAPDLAIEIISRSEEPADMARKVGEYFASGAVQVWHMFPETQTMIVFRSPLESVTYQPEDELDLSDILPASAAALWSYSGSQKLRRTYDMVLPEQIEAARDRLQDANWPNWHINDMIRRSESEERALGQLIASFGPCEVGTEAYRQLVWLTFFTARRSLPCWKIYCDTNEPELAVEAIEKWLKHERQSPNWEELSKEAVPSYQGERIRDCRDCDTAAAAEAVAWAVRFLLSGQSIQAAYTVSAADSAFDQSPLGSHDEFRRWFCEVAVPVAYEQREMTRTEQQAFRDFDPDTLRGNYYSPLIGRNAV